MKARDYLRAHSAIELSAGQSGAKVWEVEERYVIKHVQRDKLADAESFETYKKEVYYYREKAGSTYLPEILQAESSEDEIWLWMKKYNRLERKQPDDNLLKKIAHVLALVHTEEIPGFLHRKGEPKTLSEEAIQKCMGGWQQVIREHPDTFDEAVIKKIAEELNGIITWHDAEKGVLCHGDFHWDNLLVEEDGSLRICDWQGVCVGSAVGDLGFFVERLQAEGMSVEENPLFGFYIEEVCGLTGKRLDIGKMKKHRSAANLITSFVFWHQYLHGSEAERVGRIYTKMLKSFADVMSGY